MDFGDHSSATLTGKAWKELNAKNYPDAIAYAKKCVELYEKQAVAMQKELKKPVRRRTTMKRCPKSGR